MVDLIDVLTGGSIPRLCYGEALPGDLVQTRGLCQLFFSSILSPQPLILFQTSIFFLLFCLPYKRLVCLKSDTMFLIYLFI